MLCFQFGKSELKSTPGGEEKRVVSVVISVRKFRTEIHLRRIGGKKPLIRELQFGDSELESVLEDSEQEERNLRETEFRSRQPSSEAFVQEEKGVDLVGRD